MVTKTKTKKTTACEICGEITPIGFGLINHKKLYHPEPPTVPEATEPQILTSEPPPEHGVGTEVFLNEEMTFRDKKGRVKKKERNLIDLSRCLIFENGSYGVENLPIDPLPPVRSQWKYHNKWTYVLIRHKGMMFTLPNDFTLQCYGETPISPEELFQAVQWPELTQLFKLEQTLLEKIKVGLMVGLVALLMLFIFILMSSLEVI